MNRYTVVTMELPKDVTIETLYGNTISHLPYTKVFFEAGFVRDCSSLVKDPMMNKYRFSCKLRTDMEPITVFSNLNSVWEIENPNIQSSLQSKEIPIVLSHLRKNRLGHASTFFVVFDGVSWGSEAVTSGTFGFEKARDTFRCGDNYLSNAIILFRKRDTRQLMVNVCYQDEYEDNLLLKETMRVLGKLKNKFHYAAPETSEERTAWDRKRAVVKEAFDNAFAKTENYLHTLPVLKCREFMFKDGKREFLNRWWEALPDESKIALPVPKYLKEILFPLGWVFVKKTDGGKNYGITFEKKLCTGNLVLWFDSIHNNHQVRLHLRFWADEFWLGDYFSDFGTILYTESDLLEYCKQVEQIAVFVENQMRLELTNCGLLEK